MAPRNSLSTPKPRKKKPGTIVGIVGLIILIPMVLILVFALSSTPTDGNQTEPAMEDTGNQVGTASYAEIYQAYKENELVADDLYKGNRYRVTAKINGLTNDGLFNMTGGAMLTMETQVGNTIVFFYAEFEREEEDNLKTVKVGDTITYEGTCGSAGYWSDCHLIIE